MKVVYIKMLTYHDGENLVKVPEATREAVKKSIPKWEIICSANSVIL